MRHINLVHRLDQRMLYYHQRLIFHTLICLIERHNPYVLPYSLQYLYCSLILQDLHIHNAIMEDIRSLRPRVRLPASTT